MLTNSACVHDRSVTARFLAWAKQPRGAAPSTKELKILIVLGGDGTIRTAAEGCTGTGTYLLPLPGGTLNMLPRALYGDASWQNALKDTLADPAIKMLSGGRVADVNALFFVAAVVGAPGLWMEAREAMREGDILDAVHKGGSAFEAMFDTTIQYFISPEVSGEAEVVTVICPLVSEQMSDSEQTLGAAAIAVANATEVLGQVFIASGILRQRKSLRSYSAVTGRHELKPNESFLQLKSDYS